MRIFNTSWSLMFLMTVLVIVVEFIWEILPFWNKLDEANKQRQELKVQLENKLKTINAEDVPVRDIISKDQLLKSLMNVINKHALNVIQFDTNQAESLMTLKVSGRHKNIFNFIRYINSENSNLQCKKFSLKFSEQVEL